MAQLTVQVSSTLADSLHESLVHGSKPANEEHKQLDRLLNELGIALQPMASGEEPSNLRSFFSASVPGPSITAVTERLRTAKGVESVFVKPDDLPP